MTPYKLLIIGDHALLEMRKALPPITRADVRAVFERGERRVAEFQRPGRAKRWAKQLLIARREKVAEIIYIEDAIRAELVTAYWVGEYD